MNSDLKNRILFTIFILLIYRVGTFIPIPGVNGVVIGQFFSSKGSIFGMINMFSGGALERMSIFALNIMPYITASIIMQLMTSVYKGLESLKKEGEYGRRKINQYTKYLTIVLAIVQSVGVYYAFLGFSQSAFISDSKIFLWTTCCSLVAGTAALMWLGDRITSRGIGNGISLLIFVGIVSGMPSSFVQILELSRKGTYSWMLVILLLVLLVGIIVFIVFVEKTVRNIRIQYPNRGMMKQAGISDASYIPLKVNASGVIPPIFASSILMFPTAISQFYEGGIGDVISGLLRRGSMFYFVIFAILIAFFCFFYSTVVFNVEDVADNLKKNNCFIPGVRPGRSTIDFFDKIVTRLTVIGSIYLILVCLIPEILMARYSIPLSVGGTGLLIIVSVIIDLVTQVQSYLFSDRYNNINRKRKIRVR